MFASSNDEVQLNVRNKKLIITLNRPKALNALNTPMVKSLYSALRDVVDNKSAEMVIIKSSSDKAFCAGGDVVAVSQSAKSGGSVPSEFFGSEYVTNYLIGTLPIPYVALIHGITMGGGCGISVNGRFRVATEKTMLSMPETALGLFPDVGATHFLSRLDNNLGLFLALTGYRLKGADVMHSGLATHYINSSQLGELEEALVELSTPSDTSVEQLLSTKQPRDVPAFSLAEHLPLVRDAFGADTYEGVVQRLEADNSDFARAQIKELARMSPTSLKVAFRQIRSGEQLNLADVFPIEYRMAQHFCAGHDFHEGCRAILIDKDRNPKWKPASTDQVSDADVRAYFDKAPQELDLNAKL